VKQTLEREIKLTPKKGFSLPELGGTRLAERRFVSTYHDTPDYVLARHGVTFRHRVEDGAGVWQLKLPKGAARVELEVAGPPARPPDSMLRLLVAYLRERDVGPIARLRTRREGFRIDGAEVVSDSVAVLQGQRVVGRFHEIEVELIDGDEDVLRRLEEALRAAGAETPSGDLLPKLHQVLNLPAPGAVLRPKRGTRPAAALGIMLAEQRRRLLLFDPGTRLGSDSEDLHQLRVATRRLRAFLRCGRPLVELSWAESLRSELAWLGQALGPARDLDVLVERLAADVESLDVDADAAQGLLVGLEAERAASRQAVLEALSSERYLALLDRLDHVAEPELSSSETTLSAIAAAEWRRVRRHVGSVPSDPSDDELHSVRLRIKRVRYAAELAEHELGAKGRRFVESAKALQALLGEHQDAAVAEARIRAWAAVSPDGSVAAGRLVATERQRKRDVRRAWREAWDALRLVGRPLR
jgi:CHAD domain-containing protein